MFYGVGPRALFGAGLILVASGAAFAQSPVTPSGSGSENNPYLISQVGHLVWMGDTAANSSGRYYSMTANIDASATATWNDTGTTTAVLEGFRPIGTYSSPDTTSFRGILEGNGHTISGLLINRSTTQGVGLFAYVGEGGQIRNLAIVSASIAGDFYVGALIGDNYHGIVSSCQTSGSITASFGYAGGLIGRNQGGIVSKSFSTCTMTGYGVVGGLVGSNPLGTISVCYAAGAASADSHVGGLIGDNDNGNVSNCYATGRATGGIYAGGLVGYNGAGNVSRCYAVGPVSGDMYVGGLIGINSGGPVSDSYWDTQSSARSASAGGAGKTTAQMKQQATFVGWDFASVWSIDENVSYPALRLAADSDSDGVDDMADVCPDTVAGASVDAQGCPAVIFGDFNRDGAVDQWDLDAFTACATGPAVLYNPQNLPGGCNLVAVGGFLPADRDQDGDTDSSDFAVLQRCWSGPLPANPNCAG